MFLLSSTQSWIGSTSKGMDNDSSALPTFSSLVYVSHLTSALTRVVLTCVFAIVGVLLGAMTGAFIGKKTAGSMLRGSIKGAISGALSSAQVAEDSLVIWQFNASGQWTIFYAVELLHSVWSETLDDAKVDLTLQSAVQNQVLEDIFDNDAPKGVPKASVEMIPKFSIQIESNADGRNERINCAVCLQDFHFGEIARTLPQCQHTFHLSCIDIWLARHNSCPLCRCHF